MTLQRWLQHTKRSNTFERRTPVNCPLCVSQTLQPYNRNGTEVDVCPQCRGVWLDRGELEELAVAPPPPGPEARRNSTDKDRDADNNRDRDRDREKDREKDRERSRDRDRDDEDEERRRRRRKRKKSFGERLADVFDEVLD